jgi:hypothetical protein
VSTDNDIWGNTWLPAVLDALGDYPEKTYAVRLHFEYDMPATATFLHGDGSELTRILPLKGTNVLSVAMGAPRGLQALTINIEEGVFVIAECRYAPIEASLEQVIAALKPRPVAGAHGARVTE